MRTWGLTGIKHSSSWLRDTKNIDSINENQLITHNPSLTTPSTFQKPLSQPNPNYPPKPVLSQPFYECLFYQKPFPDQDRLFAYLSYFKKLNEKQRHPSGAALFHS